MGGPSSGRILVVEDEAHIAEGLQFNLELEGHEVEIAVDGPSALERMTDPDRHDLVILDLMLPALSGYEVLRRARAAGNLAPVLVLTAKDDVQDLLRGLEEGADDYLCKPFNLDELLARVRGLLRRRRWDGVSGDEPPAGPVRIGHADVYFDRFEVHTPGGVEPLTAREVGLLRALVERRGDAVTRGELLEGVWGLRPETRTRVVDTFVSRLRRYVEPDPSRPRHIVSVRGHGYRLV